MTKLLPLAVASWACLVIGCGSDDLGPRVVRIPPQTAQAGATVDLIHSDAFGDDLYLYVGGKLATVERGEARRVRFVVPEGVVGATWVVLSVDGRPSPTFPFYVDEIPAPASP
mgnify:CR=1 FL=1